jgi:hypothetical protein
MQKRFGLAQKVRRPNDGPLQNLHIEVWRRAIRAEVGTALAGITISHDGISSIRTSVRKVSGATDKAQARVATGILGQC